MEISSILACVGTLSVLLGVFDFIGDEDDWKKAAKKVVGGIIIIGLGFGFHKLLGF